MKLFQVVTLVAAAMTAGPAAFADAYEGKDFVWYCKSDKATDAQKLTVNALYGAINAKEGTSCEDAMKTLKSTIELDLSGKNLSDLAPLTGLTALRTLVVEDNQLTSLATLPELPELAFLDVSTNKINDLSPLSAQKGLVALDVSVNAIAEIPAGLLPKEMETLAISSNPIENFDFLKGVEKVSLWLDLSGLKHIRWAHFSHLVPHVSRFLDLTNSHIDSIDLPAGDESYEWQMREIHLKGTKITSLAFFKRITIPMLRGFSGPSLKTKTEANCPTKGVPSLVAQFCSE